MHPLTARVRDLSPPTERADEHRLVRTPARSALVPLLVMVVLASSALTACSSGRGSGTSANPVIVRVVDGDTVVVQSDQGKETIRLIGIDTPETKHPSKPVQCFGKEATAFTTSVLPEGTQVRLERDVEERDRYDRVLAYVYRADDDVFVNLELARQGFADVLTIAPNVAHTTEFVDAVADARDNQRGLWSSCDDFGVAAEP